MLTDADVCRGEEEERRRGERGREAQGANVLAYGEQGNAPMAEAGYGACMGVLVPLRYMSVFVLLYQ
jgi:hypothetical protein